MEPQHRKIQWFLTPLAITAAVLFAGPFAIPLVWLTPAFKRWQKVVITAALILLAIWLFRVSAAMHKTLLEEMQELQKVLNG